MQTAKFKGVKTSVTRTPDGSIIGRYWNTNVCVKNPDGSVTLNSGGWMTATTKSRMNQFANEFCNGCFKVYQKDGMWFVTVDHVKTVPYSDGMTV